MRSSNVAVAILITLAPPAQGQAHQDAERSGSPWVAGAVSAGVLGFTGEARSTPMLSGYAYAAFPRIIIGTHAGKTIGRDAHDAIYGMATLGYPARAIRESLVYPFVGAGLGKLRAMNGASGSHAVFGAGVGADRVLSDGEGGPLVGVRAGYVFRSDDAGTRAVYLTLAVGAAGTRKRAEPPPVIVARR